MPCKWEPSSNTSPVSDFVRQVMGPLITSCCCWGVSSVLRLEIWPESARPGRLKPWHRGTRVKARVEANFQVVVPAPAPAPAPV